MKIVVGSQSAIKVEAVRNALRGRGIEAEIVTVDTNPAMENHAGNVAEIIGVKASSGVSEQPINYETAVGAWNRAVHARDLVPDGDIYIIIENGIFEEKRFDKEKHYIDRAYVLAVTKDGHDRIAVSEGVEFPRDCVEEARCRGFKDWTVGKVMQERGIVTNHADPHADLGNKKPRARILEETVADALSGLLKWVGVEQAPSSWSLRAGA